jgi:hypothetical protein
MPYTVIVGSRQCRRPAFGANETNYAGCSVTRAALMLMLISFLTCQLDKLSFHLLAPTAGAKQITF